MKWNFSLYPLTCSHLLSLHIIWYILSDESRIIQQKCKWWEILDDPSLQIFPSSFLLSYFSQSIFIIILLSTLYLTLSWPLGPYWTKIKTSLFVLLWKKKTSSVFFGQKGNWTCSFFHNKTNKRVFLWPNMGQKCIKVLIRN